MIVYRVEERRIEEIERRSPSDDTLETVFYVTWFAYKADAMRAAKDSSAAEVTVDSVELASGRDALCDLLNASRQFDSRETHADSENFALTEVWRRSQETDPLEDLIG